MLAELAEPISLDDKPLSQRIKNFLVSRNVPGAMRLEVDAANGLVTLRGRLKDVRNKRLCLACCSRVSGVVQIVDELTVDDRRFGARHG